MKRLIFFLAMIPALVYGQFVVSGGGGGNTGTGNGVTTIADTSANPDPGHIYFYTADSCYYTWGDGDYWRPISSLTVAQMMAIVNPAIHDSMNTLPPIWRANIRDSLLTVPAIVRNIVKDSSYTKLDDADTLMTRGGRKLKVPGLLVTGPSKFENDITVRANLTLQSALVPKVLADSGRYMVGITNDGGLRQKGLARFGATPTPLYITTNGRIGNTLTPQHMFVAVGNTAALSGFNFVNPNRNKARGDTTASTDTSSVYGGIRGGYPTIGVRSNFGVLEWQVQNGWAQVGVKLTVADSFRVNLASKLIGGAAIGAGTAWYTAEDSTVDIKGKIVVSDSGRIDGTLKVTEKATFQGDITYSLRHAFIAFQDSAQVIDVTKDVFARVTNEGDSLFSTVEAANVTVAGDSMTIVTAGDYWTDARVEVEGGNGDRFRVAIFKNGAEVFSVSAKLASANDSKLLSLAYYLEDLAAGDDLSLRITNLTDNDDPTVTSGTWYLRKEHD